MVAAAHKKVVNLGVAGLGRSFTLMLPTFLADDRVRLAGACDPREEARTRFASDFRAPAYASFEELAADPAVDAIYIATPHQMHAEQTVMAARHGKHVLVEKPMALTEEDCDAMIEACDAAKVSLIVGHCHSFDKPYAKAAQAITDHGLGAVRMIQAVNYTDFLYRPRRPEELDTSQGGGVVFSQAAHQVDVVRLLAGGSKVTRVRALLGSWDASRPTEGAYTALLWFASGAFASLSYSGYGHFDSDEWCGWIGEMGQTKDPSSYGQARKRLRAVASPQEEARLKSRSTYGGPNYVAPKPGDASHLAYQHFGPIIVSCERGDVRPLPDAVWVYTHDAKIRCELDPPVIPRSEVMDELIGAVVDGGKPLHDGRWAKDTLAVCRAMLRSAAAGTDIVL